MPAWVADDGFRGFLLDPADQRALRIGRAVLASERGRTDDDQIAQDLMAHFLAAGDNE